MEADDDFDPRDQVDPSFWAGQAFLAGRDAGFSGKKLAVAIAEAESSGAPFGEAERKA